jgi:hypothetical protein
MGHDLKKPSGSRCAAVIHFKILNLTPSEPDDFAVLSTNIINGLTLRAYVMGA